MHLRVVDRSRHDLHRLVVLAIPAELREIRPPLHELAMPLEEQRFGEGSVEVAIDAAQHRGNAPLRRADPASVGLQPELPPQRRLHAVAVQRLAFDLGGLERLGADQVEDDRQPLIVRQMAGRTHRDTAAAQELGLPRRQGVGSVAEPGPVWMLPIPLHER